MTRVYAPSRLHFGLLSVVPATVNPEADGIALRRFGGVGVMVNDPGIRLSAEPASAWSAEGPLAERALAFARRIAAAPFPVQPCHLRCESCPPEHVGLGVGTQLGLAVARAVTTLSGSRLSSRELASLVGRGERSGIGVHGFDDGGCLVDLGKPETAAIAPTVLRIDWPAEWPIVLALPRTPGVWAGQRERLAFARSRPLEAMLRLSEQLCRLVLLGLMPALHECDWATFGTALHEYNRLAGEPFSLEQGGIYATPEVSQLITQIQRFGIPGTGQSSWGPTVFAVCQDGLQAERLMAHLRSTAPADLVLTLTTACRHGARIET